jgi:hypothetical protein
VRAGPPDSGGGGKTARVLLSAGEAADGGRGRRAGPRAAQGGRGVGRQGKGRGLGLFLFHFYLFIYFLFPLSFVSIPSDLISSSSTPSQMRRIHSKQNRQSKEICTPT